uniref:Uncharacterized protein n=1 Tax=Steinernema glaseri TaxID=37863 RepID=A0A1I7ZMI9_9BILA
MDTIPYDFVASVMRVRLLTQQLDEFNECALLGANYGTIATQIAGRAVDCSVDILGEDSHGISGEVSRPPLFRSLTKKEYVEVASFSPVDISCFTVVIGDQQATSDNTREGLSLCQFHSMMQRCRFVACRRLFLRGFDYDTLLRQVDGFFSAPHMTSFFNAVVLQYQESASFKKLFLMIADRMMLKTLWFDIMEDTNSAPLWLQETLTRIFFQPQFDFLTFSLQTGGNCSWTHAFVDSLVVRWMETPETFSKTSKTIGYPYHAFLTSTDLLSKYEFHKVKRPGRLAYRRFDCAHPTDMERRMIAKVYAKIVDAFEFTNVTDNDVQEGSSDYSFCTDARYMALTFAHNDGDMALSRTNLNCSPKTVKQEQYFEK